LEIFKGLKVILVNIQVCEIEAYPPPAIYWKRGEIVITNNSTFQISHFTSSDEKTTSTLKVSGFEGSLT
jgi:hypothetical protein